MQAPACLESVIDTFLDSIPIIAIIPHQISFRPFDPYDLHVILAELRLLKVEYRHDDIVSGSKSCRFHFLLSALNDVAVTVYEVDRKSAIGAGRKSYIYDSIVRIGIAVIVSAVIVSGLIWEGELYCLGRIRRHITSILKQPGKSFRL